MPKIPLICEECGNGFEVYPSRFKMGYPPKFCSRDCAYSNMRSRETENRRMVNCDHCGIDFRLYNYRIRDLNFCSTKCLGDFKNKQVEIKCENCESHFKVKKSRLEKQNPRYCSWMCRNEGFNGDNSPLYTKWFRFCEHCGEEFMVRPSQVESGKGRYCSKSCKHESQKCGNPTDNKHFYSLSFWHELRKQCFERDGYTCTKCGATDKLLHAHHIVPRRLNGPDELSNLISLCASCHLTIEHALLRKERTS